MRTFAMNSISFNRFKIYPMRWLLVACFCFVLAVCSPLSASAAITQIEEYPGQMLYQSRQTLQDRNGNSWQVIAFKRIHPEGSAVVSLRLIGFADGVEFDHTQPLTLTTSMGQRLAARDVSSDISQDTLTPANVGEYDIQPVLATLQTEIPLQLTLPMVTGSPIELQIPTVVIQEWQAMSAR
jgi:Protein of unknown function (DUF3122)